MHADLRADGQQSRTAKLHNVTTNFVFPAATKIHLLAHLVMNILF